MIEEKKMGCVYFFRHLGLSPVKIGYSENESPIKRYEAFKVYAPFGAELLGFITLENAKKVETDLHQRYKDKRLKGEWFELSSEEVAQEIRNRTAYPSLVERSLFWEKYAVNKCSKKDTLIKKEDVVLEKAFEDWMDTFDFDGFKINRKKMKDDFIKFSEIKITSQSFNKKVNHYCDYKNIYLSEKKNNGNIFFYFDLIN